MIKPDKIDKGDSDCIRVIEDKFIHDDESSPKKLANRLTLFRALLIPVFISFLLYEQPLHALLTFIVAAVTDVIDGFVARKWNQQTALGAMLDPLADKFLITSAFIMLSFKSQTNLNPIPTWLSVLVITRDIMIIAVSIITHMTRGEQNVTPSLYGKIATFLQITMIALILIYNNIGLIPLPLKYFFVLAVGFFTVLSGIHYLFRTAGGK